MVAFWSDASAHRHLFIDHGITFCSSSYYGISAASFYKVNFPFPHQLFLKKEKHAKKTLIFNVSRSPSPQNKNLLFFFNFVLTVGGVCLDVFHENVGYCEEVEEKKIHGNIEDEDNKFLRESVRCYSYRQKIYNSTSSFSSFSARIHTIFILSFSVRAAQHIY
jgi:hypothetical protein